jgi:glutathione S-transferase
MVRFDSFDAGSAFKQAVAAQNPVGKVPVLVEDDGFAVWDTLAIAETLAEQFPEKQLWAGRSTGPRPRPQRLRRDAQRLRRPAQRLPDEHRGLAAGRRRAGVARPARRARRPGPPGGHVERAADAARRADALRFLFSIADAYFAPVVMRIRTYALPVPAPVAAYIERLCALPGVKAWVDGAWRKRTSWTSRNRTAWALRRPSPQLPSNPPIHCGDADLSGGRIGARRVAGPAGQGPGLGGGRRHARADERAGLPAGGQGFPGLPASADPRGVRAGAHRAQDRARLQGLRRPHLARGDAGRRPGAARFDYQFDSCS